MTLGCDSRPLPPNTHSAGLILVVERGTSGIFQCAGAEKTSGTRKWALGQATEEGVRTLGLGWGETRWGGNACAVGFQELCECLGTGMDSGVSV